MRTRESFSTGDVARFLDRSRESVRRYEALGLIPPAQRDPISGRRFWTRDDVDQILATLRPEQVGEVSHG